jgi:hypothetical protein
MAYAPLVGQDGGSYGFDLPDGASYLFLPSRLDEPNHVESAHEIRAGAHTLLSVGRARRRATPAEFSLRTQSPFADPAVIRNY